MAQRLTHILRPLPLVLAVALGALYLGAELYLFERPAFPLDDAWIHLQLARNLSAGHGLAYHPGQPVSASTAPLWTALLSLGFALPGGLPLLWPKFLGLILLPASLTALGRLADSMGLTPWSRAGAQLMLLIGPWWIWSALSGMEILLFSTLSLLAIERRQRALVTTADETRGNLNDLAAVVLAAAACLVRPEGLLLLVLLLAEPVVRRSTRLTSLGLGALGAAAILLPTAVYYQSIGGSPLPATFAAKTAGSGEPAFNAFWQYSGLVVDFFRRSQPVLGVLALIGIALQLLPGPRDRRLTWVPALWLLGQPLAYGLIAARGGTSPMGNFGRYYFPLLPIVAVLGMAALESAWHRWTAGDRRPGQRSMVAALGLSLLAATQLGSAIQGLPRYLQTVANVEDSDVRAALWMARRLPADAHLAAQDIGAVKFFLPNHPLMDLAGLVDPEVRQALSHQDTETYWEERLARLARRRGVDFILVFKESYPALSRQGSGFKIVQEWSVKNNVTMAGSHLVLLQAPWSRLGLPPADRPSPRPGHE